MSVLTACTSRASTVQTRSNTARCAALAGRYDGAEKFAAFRKIVSSFSSAIHLGDWPVAPSQEPFAGYLQSVHRKVHREFAFGFLWCLPLQGRFADESLRTEVEFAINGDGTIADFGVTEPSSYFPFDYGVYDSVMRSAPFEPPPTQTLSSDGRFHVRWAFYRDDRQCGLYSVRAYLLKRLPASPAPSTPENADPKPTP